MHFLMWKKPLPNLPWLLNMHYSLPPNCRVLLKILSDVPPATIFRVKFVVQANQTRRGGQCHVGVQLAFHGVSQILVDPTGSQTQLCVTQASPMGSMVEKVAHQCPGSDKMLALSTANFLVSPAGVHVGATPALSQHSHQGIDSLTA